MNMKPLCICFAAAPGSGISSISYRLSWELDLPIFSNNSIRNEIRSQQEIPGLDVEAYNTRREQYLEKLFGYNRSFIYDASVDRKWGEFKQDLEQRGYRWLLISLDFSLEFVRTLNTHNPGRIADEHMANYAKHHEDFLAQHREDINLHITEDTFPQRFELSLATAKEALSR
jgi:hypothetical protein